MSALIKGIRRHSLEGTVGGDYQATVACDDPDFFNIIKDLTTFANFTTRPSDLMNPTHICVNLFNDLGKAELKSEKFDVNGDCIEMFNHVAEFKSEGSAYIVNRVRSQVSENALGVPASELSIHEGRPRAANPAGQHSNCHHLGGYPTLSGAGVCLHLRLSTSCITSLIFTANASSSYPNHSNFSSTSRYFTPADHDRSHSRHPVQGQYTFGPASTEYDHNTGYGYDSPGRRGKYEARVNQRKARYSWPYEYVPPRLQVDLGPLCAQDFPPSRAWKKDHERLVSLTKSTAVRRSTHHPTVRPNTCSIGRTSRSPPTRTQATVSTQITSHPPCFLEPLRPHHCSDTPSSSY